MLGLLGWIVFFKVVCCFFKIIFVSFCLIILLVTVFVGVENRECVGGGGEVVFLVYFLFIVLFIILV